MSNYTEVVWDKTSLKTPNSKHQSFRFNGRSAVELREAADYIPPALFHLLGVLELFIVPLCEAFDRLFQDVWYGLPFMWNSLASHPFATEKLKELAQLEFI